MRCCKINSISCVWPKGSAFIGYWWHWEGEGNMGLWEMDMFHIPPRMNPDVENDEKGQCVQNCQYVQNSQYVQNGQIYEFVFITNEYS